VNGALNRGESRLVVLIMPKGMLPINHVLLYRIGATPASCFRTVFFREYFSDFTH